MKKWISGAKCMNEKIKYNFSRMWKLLDDIPDCTVEPIDNCDNEIRLHIHGHEPLECVICQYEKKDRFWSQNFQLNFLVKLEGLGYKVTKKSLNKLSAGNALLRDRMKNLTNLGGNVAIKENGGEDFLCVTFLPGAVTKLMIPPITQFIEPKQEEIALALQILQLYVAVLLK